MFCYSTNVKLNQSDKTMSFLKDKDLQRSDTTMNNDTIEFSYGGFIPVFVFVVSLKNRS
ncbi:MAG: hypothetical protein PWQ84_1728 [Thermotogaceae bacterium]|jgi:hypothetical protein|nr:hypothetical protein [Thermotogaceae bacterium]